MRPLWRKGRPQVAVLYGGLQGESGIHREETRMKYYKYGPKIFKSHNRKTAVQYVYDKIWVSADQGYKKEKINKKLERLYGFDLELDAS